MLDSLNVLLVGMVVVFLALILLTFIIFLIPKIIGIKRNNKKSAVVPKIEKQPEYHKLPEVKNLIEPATITNIPKENEIVAVITAALHAFLSAVPENEGKTFKLLSYRRTTGTAPIWNRTGRLIQTANRSQGI